MNRPDDAIKLPVDVTLTYIALGYAAHHLPAAKHYKLVVHPRRARYAMGVIGLQAEAVDSNPLAPSIGLETGDFTNESEWQLWSGEECAWSAES